MMFIVNTPVATVNNDIHAQPQVVFAMTQWGYAALRALLAALI